MKIKCQTCGKLCDEYASFKKSICIECWNKEQHKLGGSRTPGEEEKTGRPKIKKK